jgi:hypothetical protein
MKKIDRRAMLAHSAAGGVALVVVLGGTDESVRRTNQ